MGRPPCCDKSNVKRGLWTPEEDAKILAHVSKHGTGNWTLVPQKAGLNRCGKSCRLRWTNYLRPDLNHDDFTPQEEEHIINLHQAIGSRWSLIAKQLPGRTDNDVKNYWNTKLRKKLSKMGIDPVTHKPISQLLSEFGNISSLPSPGHHVVVPRMETSSAITGLPSSDMIARLAKEQFQDCNSFSAMEFLSQLQVTNQDIIQTHFFNEVTSSSSSTSSSLVTADLASPRESYSRQQPQAQPLAPSPSLNWSEFLLREPYQHSDVAQQEQEDDFQGVLSSSSPVVSSQSEISVQKPANGSEFCSLNAGDFGTTVLGGQMNNQIENSSANSFVDTILDRDTELRSAFPEFLDGSLEYY